MQEETVRDREAELGDISIQAALDTQSGRAKRPREVVTEHRQRTGENRTPDRTDFRERLSRMELATVTW